MVQRAWVGLVCAWLSVGCMGCMSAYSPAAPVVPLLSERGSVVAGAKIRPAYPLRGMSAYVAAAPTEHTRLYVSGTWARAHGATMYDDRGRELEERNETKQAELGAGWGTATAHLRAEVLAGMGYGSMRSAQCERNWLENQDECGAWVDGQARFARVFVQAQLAAHFKHWTGGGGLRVGDVQYRYEQLLERATERTALIITAEPFIVHHLELPYGALEFMLHVPIVAYSPSVTTSVEPTTGAPHTSQLVETPVPRIYLGFQANIDRLWR